MLNKEISNLKKTLDDIIYQKKNIEKVIGILSKCLKDKKIFLFVVMEAQRLKLNIYLQNS